MCAPLQYRSPPVPTVGSHAAAECALEPGYEGCAPESGYEGG